MTRIGVLALQGAVQEHLDALERVGVAGAQVRRVADLEGLDGLILPGGESTAISRLIGQGGLTEPLRRFGAEKPVFGTCAGMILCAARLKPHDTRVEPLGLLECAVARNGFGRQRDSFEQRLDIPGIGADVPAVFIRAPYMEAAGPGVQVLARVNGRIVMAESGRTLVAAFHPELTPDTRVLEYFCRKACRKE